MRSALFTVLLFNLCLDVHICVQGHVYGGQRSALDVSSVLHIFFETHFFFLRDSSTLSPRQSEDSLNLLGSLT